MVIGVELIGGAASTSLQAVCSASLKTRQQCERAYGWRWLKRKVWQVLVRRVEIADLKFKSSSSGQTSRRRRLPRIQHLFWGVIFCLFFCLSCRVETCGYAIWSLATRGQLEIQWDQRHVTLTPSRRHSYSLARGRKLIIAPPPSFSLEKVHGLANNVVLWNRFSRPLRWTTVTIPPQQRRRRVRINGRGEGVWRGEVRCDEPPGELRPPLRNTNKAERLIKISWWNDAHKYGCSPSFAARRARRSIFTTRRGSSSPTSLSLRFSKEERRKRTIIGESKNEHVPFFSSLPISFLSSS